MNATVEGLHSLLEVEIMGPPPLDPELIDGIIRRDAVALLGLDR